MSAPMDHKRLEALRLLPGRLCDVNDDDAFDDAIGCIDELIERGDHEERAKDKAKGLVLKLTRELKDAKTACEHNRSEAESLREQRREDTATRKRLMGEVMDARAFAKTSVTAMQVQLDRAVGLAENATAETSRARGIAEQWAAKAERLNDAIGAAILASDNGGGSAGDAIQDMLSILREASP